MNFILLDVQGFSSSKCFVLKEFAYSYVNEKYVHTIMFEPPFDWNLLSYADKKTNRYLTYYFHSLKWYDGLVPYRDIQSYLESTLQPDNSTLLVKGAEKQNWLQQLLPRAKIIDLTAYNCPALKKLTKMSSIPCANHSSLEIKNCAKHNVINLKNWCKINQSKLAFFLS